MGGSGKIKLGVWCLVFGVGCWVIANNAYAEIASTSTYKLQIGGYDQAGPAISSSGYKLKDTVGLNPAANSSSTNYKVASGYQGITNAIPTSDVANYNDGHIYLDETPTLEWSYLDKDTEKQRTYHVQVSRDDFATFVVDTGSVSSSDAYYTPSPLPRTEGLTLHKWRVRTHDGFDWSGWYTGNLGFRITIAPGLDITVLGVFTEPLGQEILPMTWQRDNDPYLYWEPPLEGVEIAGYSYSWDEVPDEIIDTTTTSYSCAKDFLTDGIHTFYVKAQSNAGEWGNPAQFEIWVDTTGPSVLEVNPREGSVIRDDHMPIWVMLSEAHSGIDPTTVTMKINNAEVITTYDEATQKVSYAPQIPLSEGDIIVSFDVQDKAGNDGVPFIWSFVVDTVGPTGSILINNGELVSPSVYVNLNLTTEDATTEVTQMMLSNDSTFSGAVWERFVTQKKDWTLIPINGKRSVYVKFKDEAGNESPVFSDDIELIIAAPDTIITSGPSGITTSTEALFGFKASKPGCSFSWRFDKEDWSPWSSETSILRVGLCLGNHYFAVKAAKDLDSDDKIELDEEDPTPSQRTWTIQSEITPKPRPKKPIKYWRKE